VASLAKSAVNEIASQSMSSLGIADCLVLGTQSFVKRSCFDFFSLGPDHSSLDSWLAIAFDELA
jgi:hypothetical protein